MLNVLSIGNSFSQDAQTYLHQVARAEKESIFCVNLCIGGCSLERHFRNIMGDKRDYEIQVCGKSSGFYTSVKEALLSRKWDVITIQQASHFSMDFSTYVPYLEEVAAYIRKYAPGAKLYIHETWGYESGSDRIRHYGFETMKEMSEQLAESNIVRCHRSYMINLDLVKVMRREKGNLFLELEEPGVREIPISKTYGEQVLRRLVPIS